MHIHHEAPRWHFFGPQQSRSFVEDRCGYCAFLFRQWLSAQLLSLSTMADEQVDFKALVRVGWSDDWAGQMIGQVS